MRETWWPEVSECTYAHTPGPLGTWHELKVHLEAVANDARTFAQPFGAGEPAYELGLLHDLGKANPAFQEYLRAQAEGRQHPTAPHAIWGAALIYRLIYEGAGDAEGWKELALPVQGHHAGLPDSGEAAQAYEQFLAEDPEALQIIRTYLQRSRIALTNSLKLPRHGSTRRELFIRMLFSALVDADFLDTERHFDPERRARRGGWPNLESLWWRLKTSQERLLTKTENEAKNILLKRLRREVYEDCVRVAEGPPGVYRLTVPTGGGKTRSGLAFALRHALVHGLRRVVVAIPYTSIIDQTAQVYRHILGDEAVLEHHSQLEPKEDESQDELALRYRLASENWETPLIVTTTVQLFESLFSNRPSRARKLHRLAGSIILLDEVQTLPPGLLEPTLDALRALVEGYGVSVVLSTATQPAFEESPYLEAFRDLTVREIVPGYPQHFRELRRVEYERQNSPLSWLEVAREVQEKPQIMVVLNSRRDALNLLDTLGHDQNAFHLSTLLCGAHRREVLEEVRRRLKENEQVRLVSTQVVEAGVDLDFPEVWRAVGPLDRIVQAAGRCNREGELEAGRVVIFTPVESRAPRGPYRVGLEKSRLVLERYPAEALHEPEIYRQYFRELFDAVDLDSERIQTYRDALSYPEVARRYRLIGEATSPVVAPYGAATERLRAWKANPSRVAWRRLQPYLINLHQHELPRLEQEGWIEAVRPEVLYRWKGGYDERRGLVEYLDDPGDLIA